MLLTVGVRVGLPALGRFVLDSSRPHAMLTIGARTGHALGLVSAGFPIVSEPGIGIVSCRGFAIFFANTGDSPPASRCRPFVP